MDSMIPQPQRFAGFGALERRVVSRAPALLFLLAGLFVAASSVWASSKVTLSATTSPTAGQAGITSVNVTGSGFPAGVIPAANVTVTLQPAGSSGPSVTATASAVTTILGTVRRVTFQIPSSIGVSTPTTYNVSIAGTTSTGVAFLSGNASALTVNPPAQIVSLSPALALAGQTISVLLVGQYTNFVPGVTQANFGAGISVGGAAEGASGPVTVTTPITLTAEISLDPASGQGARTVTVVTGAQQAVMANGFMVDALASIAVTPANPSIAVGATQQFTATGTYNGGSTQNLTSTVTWGSSAPGVATITTGGLAKGVKAGASTISATLGGIAGSTTLTVTAPALVSIAVTPANPSIAVGATQQFTATGTYSDGSTQNLTSTATWSSSAPSVATIAAGGLAKGVKAGTSTISAALSSITGSTTLTVTPVLVSMAVTPANPSIAAGDTEQFMATGTYSDGSTQNLTSTATWASSAPGVATITAGGLATGVKAGASTISATLNSITGSTTLTVTAAVLVSIAVTPANPSIAVGTTLQFTATGTYSDGSTQNLTSTATWSSSATGVATISTTGLASAVAAGQTTIEAAVGAINGSTTLNVLAGGTFVWTGSLNAGRGQYTATLLNDGLVLIAGGRSDPIVHRQCRAVQSHHRDFYPYRQPEHPTLHSHGDAAEQRHGAGCGRDRRAQLFSYALQCGTVQSRHWDLLVHHRQLEHRALRSHGDAAEQRHGADRGRPDMIGFTGNLASAELYDPATGTFTPTGSMNAARAFHTATLLNNGMVLIAGWGNTSSGLSQRGAVHPATGTFTLTGAGTLRATSPRRRCLTTAWC